MKRILQNSLLALGLFNASVLPADASNSFSETFSAATLNATRWKLSIDGGLLSPSDGKLHYSLSNTNGDSSSDIILRGINPRFNESWEVLVDAANSNRAASLTWIGVKVFNAADKNDWVELEIEGGNDGPVIYSDFATNNIENPEVVRRISSTKVSLRVTFSHVTKIITLWYRTSPTTAWKNLSTFSTTNKTTAMRRGNWRMKSTDRFVIGLYGGGDAGAIVPLGTMSLDDFVIRNHK